MTHQTIIERTASDVYPALVSSLEREFGSSEVGAIAVHFLEAEAAEFHWSSRMMERHLGQFETMDDEIEADAELDRVGVIGVLNGAWFVAVCIVDGEGEVHGMQQLTRTASAWDADDAFIKLH